MGPDEDYNEWARRVGDDAWNWQNVKRRMKKIENYQTDMPEEQKKYINPKAQGIHSDLVKRN
jgi:uncharacterized protein YydD (DUF2326 family)